MQSTLLHIYGPFAIHSYGLMIAIALLITTWLMQRSTLRKQLMSQDELLNAIMAGTLICISGGRALYLVSQWDTLESWTHIFNVWEGGLSLLGAVLATLIFLPLYLRIRGIPIMRFLDLVGLYAPLLIGISRIGCFFAGCCYGSPTELPWGVTYTQADSLAPVCVRLHPTQLYSTLTLVAGFLFVYYLIRPRIRIPGQLFCLSILLVAIERFMIDFLRGDQEFLIVQSTTHLSLHQWISLAILISVGILFIALSYWHGHRRAPR